MRPCLKLTSRSHAILARYYADQDHLILRARFCLSCLRQPSECLYHYHVCMYFRRCLQVHISPTCHAFEPTNSDPVPSPLAWTVGQQLTREARRNNHKQPHCVQHSIYSLYIHPTRSTIVLACLAGSLPTLFRVLDQTIVKPARLFGTPPPHVSSLRDLSSRAAAPPLHTMSTSLLPPASLWRLGRWLVPRGRHGDGSGSTGMQPHLPYRDEGSGSDVLFAYAPWTNANLPTSRVGRGCEVKWFGFS